MLRRPPTSSSSFFRVAINIVMPFVLLVASPSRWSSRRVGVMAFRNVLRANIKGQHNIISSTSIVTTAMENRVVASNGISSLPSHRCNASRFMSTKYSIREEDRDYNSMTVSDLRELLRQRGLVVSGIKAQLVERLQSGEINPGKIGRSPKIQRNEMKKSNRMRSDEDRFNIDHGSENEMKDDLSGLVNHLKSLEAGNEAKTVEREKMQNLNRQTGPKNLVFAKDGEEESDDEWGDDEDYEEESDDDGDYDDNDLDDDDFDPNTTTARTPPINRSRSGGDATSFREDFQGTRVFVQGLPEEATWKDLKDHFKQSIAGEVVFASVSIDKNTGKSKKCGIVQFETPSMAKVAIREMRNYPMNGATLYVREDVQESKQREGSRGGRLGNDDWYENETRPKSKTKSSIPTEWKRANDKDKDGEGDMWYNLKDDELKEIESIIQNRDGQRRQNNYKMSDKLREKLKDDFGVHLDDRLKLWWTDTKHGGVPKAVSDIKGEGRWGNLKPWRQIPTNPKSDAMVDSDHVMQLLSKRDKARKKKDFDTADELLQKAYSAPRGGLTLRIHDESRTWRIWTEAPPQKKEAPSGYEKLTPVDMCLQLVKEKEPDKVDEMIELLKKFPGREWSIFKRLKGRYDVSE